MKTYSARPQDIQRDWYVVDASDKVLGRLASAIAHRLRGKHKPIFTPHIDTGDFIVVTNVEKIKVTGNKVKTSSIIAIAVIPAGSGPRPSAKCRGAFPAARSNTRSRACSPRGRSGTPCSRSSSVYAGSAHPHAAQQPKTLEL